MRGRSLWTIFGTLVIAVLAVLVLAPRCSSPKSYAQGPADINILFVGNSHTQMHNLPELVREMIQFRHPKKTVRVHAIWVSLLEKVAGDRECRKAREAGR